MFLLLLMVLGAASVKAQVRIGGNGAPQGAAVLDLNADDTATPAANKGALALPRVSLASTTAQLNGATPITGMLVYNTNATLGVGIYFYNGSNWVPIDGDGVIGNEVTNATSGGGLVRAGSGTAVSPYTLGIAKGGVDTSMLAPMPSNLSWPMWYNGGYHIAKITTLMYTIVNIAGIGAANTPAFDMSHCMGYPWVIAYSSYDGSASQGSFYYWFNITSYTSAHIAVESSNPGGVSIGIGVSCIVLN